MGLSLKILVEEIKKIFAKIVKMDFNLAFFLALALVSVAAASGEKVPRSASGGRCCDQLYLSASGAIVDTQEGLLGIYRWAGIHNYRPYYVKILNEQTKYFYFKDRGISPGWTLSADLTDSTVYISTRADDFPSCPVGVTGAFDRDSDADFDATFSVECHSDAVAKECDCVSLWANATEDVGSVAANQSVFLGEYDLHGAYNGYPVYYMRKYNVFDAFLYFRKQGDLNKDGWTLSPSVGSPAYAVTTRDRSLCPDAITVGWDRNLYRDDSFSVSCVGDVQAELSPTVDPFAPLAQDGDNDTATTDNSPFEEASDAAVTTTTAKIMVGTTTEEESLETTSDPSAEMLESRESREEKKEASANDDDDSAGTKTVESAIVLVASLALVVLTE